MDLEVYPVPLKEEKYSLQLNTKRGLLLMKSDSEGSCYRIGYYGLLGDKAEETWHQWDCDVV